MRFKNVLRNHILNKKVPVACNKLSGLLRNETLEQETMLYCLQALGAEVRELLKPRGYRNV